MRGALHMVAAATVPAVLLTLPGTALARPLYGNNCIQCHSSDGFGNTVTNAVFDVAGTSQSTIPPGFFGDPDRGEGPLQTYTAIPGGTFTLTLDIHDTQSYSPPFLPTRWAVALSDIFHTDPDWQLGDPDPLNWRDAQLTLVGAPPAKGLAPDPVPIPSLASQWSLYTNFLEEQYYATTDNGGHEWIGPFLLSVVVDVPAGVLPGWYDIRVMAAGWDYGQIPLFAFYDEEHFYLNVIPEPSTALLLLFVPWAVRRRRRFCLAGGALSRQCGRSDPRSASISQPPGRGPIS